eukprot:scaffold119_cov79-Skeletonema_dohrnii-CCMP3373.AAC.3
MQKIQKIFSIFGGVTAVLLPFGDVFCKCSSDNKEMLISNQRKGRIFSLLRRRRPAATLTKAQDDALSLLMYAQQ